MTIIRANGWTPDQADTGSSGMITATNCLPGTNSYTPMPDYAAVSTTALDDYARGAIDVRDKDLNAFQYAGDELKLYRLSGTTWTDASQVGGYATGTEERWEFEQWKNVLIATNFSDDPQVLTLGGTTFADLTTSLRARHVAKVDQHVVFCNTYDGTDGNVPDRVWTSAYDDHTDYTPDSTTGSSVRDLGGGPIERIFGGEFGVILCRDKVYRMSWVGAPAWFNIDQTVTGVGTVAPGACAQLGNDVYTYSRNGFYRIVNGSQEIPIGTSERGMEIVDDFMAADLDSDYLYRMSCVADPKSGRIFWLYPGAGNNAGQPNRIICYDSKLQKWSTIDIELDNLWAAGGVGYTLEQLDTISSDIDALPASLDSSVWKGGGILSMGAFGTDQNHGFFTGDQMTATFVSPEQEFNEGRHSMHLRHTAMVEGGSVTARVGYRNSLRDDPTWTTSISENRWGRLPKRVKARYHRLEVTVSGTWTHFIGWQLDADDVRATGKNA